MLVVCINDNWAPTEAAINNPKPGIGDQFLVIDEVYCAKFGGIFYELDKFPNCFYYKDMFVEIPDLTADEMAEEEFEGIANLETV